MFVPLTPPPMEVPPRAKVKVVFSSDALKPHDTNAVTSILLLALVGVMETDKPVISTKVADAVLKVDAVTVVDFACTTPPAAKVKFALSDAAVRTSPLVYVVNGIVPTLR